MFLLGIIEISKASWQFLAATLENKNSVLDLWSQWKHRLLTSGILPSPQVTLALCGDIVVCNDWSRDASAAQWVEAEGDAINPAMHRKAPVTAFIPHMLVKPIFGVGRSTFTGEMLLSEELGNWSTRGSLGLRHQELGFRARIKALDWVSETKGTGLFLRTGAHFPGTVSVRAELCPPQHHSSLWVGEGAP